MMNRIENVLLAAALLLAVGCAEEESVFPQGQGAASVLATKAVNTAEDALDGELLLLLDETLADRLAGGSSDDELEKVCGELGVTSLSRVFRSSADDALARAHRLHRWYKVRFPSETGLVPAAERLASLSSVTGVQFNTRLKKELDGNHVPWTYYSGHRESYGEFGLPFNDPLLVDQWHYINNADLSVAPTVREGADINVKDAWRLTGGVPQVIVAICDEGVKYDHPDLAPNMWVNSDEIPGNGIDDDQNGYVDDVHGWNFLSSEDYNVGITWDADNDSGHGTHVAGTVAAVNNNGLGVSGIAGGTGKGDGVRIMSCQLFSGDATAGIAARSEAYEYAARNGACIVQCSFGNSGGMYSSDRAFEELYSVEIDALEFFMDYKQPYSPVDRNFVIFAAGNETTAMSGYPAAYHSYLSVAAFGPDFLPANYTNYGPGVNICAPGGDVGINSTSSSSGRAMILSTVPAGVSKYDGDYGYMQGTSMACPHVSGVVALGLSYAIQLGKTFTYDEFLSMVLTSVNDIDYYIETATKQSYGVDMNLVPYWKNMGTGAIDAWKLLMQVEGVPCLVAKINEESRISLDEYFGEAAENLIYTAVEADDVAVEALGLVGTPRVENGKLIITCTKHGSAKIRISAIAGGDVVGGGTHIGGTEFSREVSVLSREVAASNGGWL